MVLLAEFTENFALVTIARRQWVRGEEQKISSFLVQNKCSFVDVSYHTWINKI